MEKNPAYGDGSSLIKPLVLAFRQSTGIVMGWSGNSMADPQMRGGLGQGTASNKLRPGTRLSFSWKTTGLAELEKWSAFASKTMNGPHSFPQADNSLSVRLGGAFA